MKKIILTLFCLLVLGGPVNGASAAVKVVVEGNGDEYPHYLNMRTGPVIEEGIIIVPLQDLADAMSWEVFRVENTPDFHIEGNGRILQMAVGSPRAAINSSPADSPISPYIDTGSIMIPLAFTAESMGYYVEYSQAWDNTDKVYITPYKLIGDNELYQINTNNFSEANNGDGFITFRLKEGRTTPQGIGLRSSIGDVLKVYGVPRSPYRTRDYPGDWTGKLTYWGTFVPNSGMGAFFEFTFDRGTLVELNISC